MQLQQRIYPTDAWCSRVGTTATKNGRGGLIRERERAREQQGGRVVRVYIHTFVCACTCVCVCVCPGGALLSGGFFFSVCVVCVCMCAWEQCDDALPSQGHTRKSPNGI